TSQPRGRRRRHGQCAVNFASGRVLMPAAATLQQFVCGLQTAGLHVFRGQDSAYWVSSLDRVMKRLPTFDLTVPTTAEVDSAMVATGAIIASYVNEPSSRTPANAWLYLKGNRPYLLEERPAAMQRNVRRALREFRIAPLSASDVIQHGARAFCDTRQRNGL